ncbi:TetR/AcrR family transcriptional regulator [Actinocatenispora rupis]|uniref:TetR family transcriptional regulator n=1 Tax=Actinocatenispora rupis TaxID=519421 RepID=A0A8J3NCQ0_9ACTN|nr:TetR family transcriptional regulator [Actinocatenispora rupis]GID12022.1 TetR family transcriptional regulator [Actinocatenispora rupis]
MAMVRGRRAHRKLATRDALQRAALELVRSNGPDAVTVEEICARAGVSPRTFFNYFTSKEEAIIDWDAEIDAFVTTAVAERPPAESPVRAIRAVLASAVGDAMGMDMWQDRMELIREQPGLIGRFVAVMGSVQRALAAGVARRTGLATDHLYVAVTAAASVAAIRTAIQAWTDAPDGTDPARLIDDAFAYLESGLAPPAH